MRKFLRMLASAWLLSGCATIVGDKTQEVSIRSWPAGAKFVIQDETGRAVAEGYTPDTVTLEKSDGSYFGKKAFLLLLEQPGYVPQTIPLKQKANLWYLLGNLPLGGFPGWLLVDPFNGGMYRIEPPAPRIIMNPIGARS